MQPPRFSQGSSGGFQFQLRCRSLRTRRSKSSMAVALSEPDPVGRKHGAHRVLGLAWAGQDWPRGLVHGR